MAIYNQAQASRLGQRGEANNTQVLMFTGDNIPEAPWYGMMIYRPDLQILQVFNGVAFEDVVGGTYGILTFVGPNPPIAVSVGDLWFDTDNDRQLYRAASVGADAIGEGEWELFRDDGIQYAIDLATDAGTYAQQALQDAQDAYDAAQAANSGAVAAQQAANQALLDSEAALVLGGTNQENVSELQEFNENTFPITSVNIAPGAVGSAQIADFSLAVRKFNTLTHIIA